MLTPSQTGQRIFRFALNPGLQVHQVSFQDSSTDATTRAGAPFHSRLGWTTVDLSRAPLAHGQPIQLTIAYAEQLALDRDDYAPAIAAVSFNGAQVELPPSYPITDYVGQGVAFLEGSGSGDWYPLPWTQAIVASRDPRQPFAEVQVRVPVSFRIFCSLASPARTVDRQWQTLDVHPHGTLPIAFLAALAATQHMRGSQATIFYHGTALDRDAIQLDQMMIQQVQAMTSWLGITGGIANRPPAARSWAGVVLWSAPDCSSYLRHQLASPTKLLWGQCPAWHLMRPWTSTGDSPKR